jgi:hypothetical protein
VSDDDEGTSEDRSEPRLNPAAPSWVQFEIDSDGVPCQGRFTPAPIGEFNSNLSFFLVSLEKKNIHFISILPIAFVVPDGEEEPIDPPASSRMSGEVGSTITRDRSSIGKRETILGLFCAGSYLVLIHDLLIGPLPDSLVQSAPVSSGSLPATPGVAPQSKSPFPKFISFLLSVFIN